MKKNIPIYFNNNNLLDDKNYLDKNIDKNDKNLEIKFEKICSEKINFSLDDYLMFFNTTQFESYNLIIHSIFKSFSDVIEIPHIICSNIEHPFIIEILNYYSKKNIITVSYILSNVYGGINSSEIETLIVKDKTCLIIVSFVNYIIGTINNTKLIGEIAHKYNIPLMSDATYIIGKSVINIDNLIDIFTFNFENISVLVIKKDLFNGYNLQNQSIKFQDKYIQYNNIDSNIFKKSIQIMQNLYKLKQETFIKNLKIKNQKLQDIKKYFVNSLEKKYEILYYDYIIKNNIIPTEKNIIILGNDISNINNTLPHILSFVYMNKSANIKNKLKNENIYVYLNDNTNILENMGLLEKYAKKVITLCFTNITKKNIDLLISYL